MCPIDDMSDQEEDGEDETYEPLSTLTRKLVRTAFINENVHLEYNFFYV